MKGKIITGIAIVIFVILLLEAGGIAYLATQTDTFVGPMGPQGIQGVQGEKGVQGIKGDPGVKGDTGQKGAKGDQGSQGPTGTKGQDAPINVPSVIELINMSYYYKWHAYHHILNISVYDEDDTNLHIYFYYWMCDQWVKLEEQFGGSGIYSAELVYFHSDVTWMVEVWDGQDLSQQPFTYPEEM